VIVIINLGGVKTGYIPKADNVIFSRLMDVGKLLFARIAFEVMTGKWLKIKITVSLHE